MPEISFITTCKGRLAHLRQTLPLMAAQGAACEVVVVDYDCPDGTAAWVGRHYPAARVVHVRGEPGYSPARARNLGAEAARAPWLMFIDADVLPAPEFAVQVLPLLRPGHYYRPQPMMPDTWGSFLVAREEFLARNGYDEVLQGWGGEDDDIYYRLRNFGRCIPMAFPGQLLSALTHDDALRTRFHVGDDRWLSQRTNVYYLHIKYDLTLLAGGRVPEPAVLQSIHAEVQRSLRQAKVDGAERVHITVHLPPKTRLPMKDCRLHRQLVYDLELLPAGGIRRET